MKFDKVLDCYKICSKATECGTTGHQCEYGDDGCIDCVQRLDHDLQAPPILPRHCWVVREF